MVKKIYQSDIMGPSVNIKFKKFSSIFSPVELFIDKMMEGWEALLDEVHHKVHYTCS